jgi:hypothetical protein
LEKSVLSSSKEKYEKPHMVVESIELATLAGQYGGGQGDRGHRHGSRMFFGFASPFFGLCCN